MGKRDGEGRNGGWKGRGIEGVREGQGEGTGGRKDGEREGERKGGEKGRKEGKKGGGSQEEGGRFEERR